MRCSARSVPTRCCHAREAVAGAVWRAGLPPVTLQHMSFEVIYQQRLAELQQQQQAQQAGTTPPATH